MPWNFNHETSFRYCRHSSNQPANIFKILDSLKQCRPSDSNGNIDSSQSVGLPWIVVRTLTKMNCYKSSTVIRNAYLLNRDFKLDENFRTEWTMIFAAKLSRRSWSINILNYGPFKWFWLSRTQPKLLINQRSTAYLVDISQSLMVHSCFCHVW